MNITGYTKTTLLDYPEHLASTLFTQGCNFLCPFCHNKQLLPFLDSASSPSSFDPDKLITSIKDRQHLIEGICITGGEPTLQKDLVHFISSLKALHLNIKLDTNGSNPSILKELIHRHLVDYIAMDIKNSPQKYSETIGKAIPLEAIYESVNILLNSYSVDAPLQIEFRTTVIQEFHSYDDLHRISQWIKGGSPWYLQQFVQSEHQLSDSLFHAIPKETLSSWIESLKLNTPELYLRGYD